ncbi:hypothetical protein G6F23_014953 [Rhizopus arrhizus]|nr:hypothetical protein G6F23_014953 [Rhizopus arrhizus]
MNRFGSSGHLRSLGALDCGILVDGAVIVVESTLLMLGQRRTELGRALTAMERLRVAADSAMKMARPAARGGQNVPPDGGHLHAGPGRCLHLLLHLRAGDGRAAGARAEGEGRRCACR